MTTPEQLVKLARSRQAIRVPANGNAKPSQKLAAYIDGVTSGRIRRVKLPWPKLDSLTNALMPGAVLVLCGDPGVGKTYFLLDCLRFWMRTQVDAAFYFLEEDDTFYLRRLLAQEEGNADYANLDWWEAHPQEVIEAQQRHAHVIDELGACFRVAADLRQMELRQLTKWLEEELKNGRRVLAIDPITAASAGIERWLADDAFMMEAKALINRYGASLILVTHPRKGNVTKKSGHDQGGGAAYYRFSSANIWINRLDCPKRFEVYGEHGPSSIDTDNVLEIHKAREGTGKGRRIAMTFGNGLHFGESGVVVRESSEDVDVQPDQPMRTPELDRAMKTLAQTFPLKINVTQAATIRDEFSKFSLRVVETAIKSHYATHGGTPDVPKLLAQLRSAL